MKSKALTSSIVCVVPVIVAVFFITTSLTYAESSNFKPIKKSVVPSTVNQVKILPDLVVKTPAWSSNPKAGDVIGTASILNITILNQGSAAAGSSLLKITCLSLSGQACPGVLDGTINVQPLDPRQSMTYAWPPASLSDKWVAGKYKLTFSADASKQVLESNETNNGSQLIFDVLPKTHLQLQTTKVRPLVQEAVVIPETSTDIEVVSLSLIPTNPASGQNVEFTAVIRNSGQTKTPQAGSIMTFWDTKGPTAGVKFSILPPLVPPLNPGQTHTLKVNTSFITMGSDAGAKININLHGNLLESNKQNNEKIIFFKIQCKPELAPYNYLEPKPANITAYTKPNEELKLTIWVYNNAGCFSKAAKLSIVGDEIFPLFYNIPPINPRQRVGIPVSLKWTNPGLKQCKIFVDATNTNNESIETNNEMDLMVNVMGAWPGTE